MKLWVHWTLLIGGALLWSFLMSLAHAPLWGFLVVGFIWGMFMALLRFFIEYDKMEKQRKRQ